MTALGLGLAAVIGLCLGLLGGGGSILAVPVFVYVLGYGAKQSVAMGLAVVGATSLFGAASHWRRGNVHLPKALTFAVLAMAGTYAGARLAVYLSEAVQLSLFAVVMLVAAVSMFRNAAVEPRAVEGAAEPTPATLGVITLTSLGVGLLTGLVGVGGGFLIVPALVLFGRLPMKQAVGSSLLVIGLNAFVGLAGYAGQVELPWALLGRFVGLAVGGILVGTWLTRHVSQSGLKRAFALLLVLMGTFILFKNRSELFPPSTTSTLQLEPS